MSDVYDIFSEQLPDLLANHWPFLLVAFGLSLVGEFFKRFVWTHERALSGRFWLWGRRTLPFHPVITGLAVDLVLGKLYFTGAGILSIWLFNVARQIVKRKWDIELSLWRTSKAPSDPPPRPEKGQ